MFIQHIGPMLVDCINTSYTNFGVSGSVDVESHLGPVFYIIHALGLIAK